MMERLTYDDQRGTLHCWQVKGADNNLREEVCKAQTRCTECPIAAAFDRLAAYEDTGLMPDEIAKIQAALIGHEIAKITEFEAIPIQLRAASALEILLAERDSAMRDIRKTCKTCAFYGTPPTEYPCGHCALVERMWKWRGLQKGENHD